MKQKIETIIISGGQAGLATSYPLGQRGGEHIVLEGAARTGNTWRNDRWDSFSLLLHGIGVDAGCIGSRISGR